MLKESELTELAIQTLKERMVTIPNISIDENIELLQKDLSPDFSLKINLGKTSQQIFVEIRSHGHPKNTWNAVNALLRYKENYPNAYGVFIAPYISPKSAKICEDAGVGYMDLSGNCKIAFQQVYIYRENFPNKFTIKASLSSLYSPKSERIIRVLLTFPYRPWRTLELAGEASVSPGMITHVKKKLGEEGWIETDSDGFKLIAPSELLKDWSDHYSLQQNSISEFYSLKTKPEIENAIAETCRMLKIDYAFSGFSGSNRLAPAVRNQRAMVYVNGDIELLAEKLSLKPVSSGANVLLIRPYDEGVLWRLEEENEVRVVTPVQLYLDLVNLHGRGEEAAEILYKGVIQKSWQLQESTMTKSK